MIKPLVITCLCSKHMDVTHKRTKEEELKEVRLKCKCGITSMVLMNKNNSYDVYFYRGRKLLRYDCEVTD